MTGAQRPTLIRTDVPATDEELAAVLAAYEVLWPRPVAPSGRPPTPPWRFSGRWWRGR